MSPAFTFWLQVQEAISYPHVLNMGELCGDGAVDAVYELTSLVLHKGKSCYGGHYICHFRDEATKEWHQADDEAVTETKIYEKVCMPRPACISLSSPPTCPPC